MATKSTVERFVKNLAKLAPTTQKVFLKSWNRNTMFTRTEANKKIPVASGDLKKSGRVLRAKITPTGIASAIEYTQPYAKLLNEDAPVSRNGNPIKLKPSGVKSYKVPGGSNVNKKQQGEFAYLTKAVEQESSNFTKDIFDIIDKEWNKL